MVAIPGGYEVEHVKEAGEMVKRKAPSPAPLVPNEDPPWSALDLAIVPTSARLELPMSGLSRYELRRIGDLVQQLGAMMVRLSHQHALPERSIMFEACNSVRRTQALIGPIRRAKRRTHRDVE